MSQHIRGLYVPLLILCIVAVLWAVASLSSQAAELPGYLMPLQVAR